MSKRKIWLITYKYKKVFKASVRTSRKKALKQMNNIERFDNYRLNPVILKQVSPDQIQIKSLSGKQILGYIYIQHLEVK